MKRIALVLTVAVAIAACSQKTETAPATQNAAAPAGGQVPAAAPAQTSAVPAQPAAAAAGTPSGAFTGKVAETMNAAGYTYLKLDTPEGEKWAAVRETSVKKGQNVTVNVQMVAEKFESKTLKRTFDKIAFGDIAGAPAAAPGGMMSSSQQMPAGHPGMQGGGMNAMGTPQQHMSAPEIAAIKVPKAEGADAKTVGEVWAQKGALADKPVVIRGKVVKSLSGIMGKNWLHLRDGSGAEGTDDITVTTVDRANVGDVVTIKGVLRVDKDFGAGYKYAVIVEDAKVTK